MGPNSQLLIESGNVALLEQSLVDAISDACITGGEEVMEAFETYAKILESKEYDPEDEFEQTLDEFLDPFFENACATYGSFLFESNGSKAQKNREKQKAAAAAAAASNVASMSSLVNSDSRNATNADSTRDKYDKRGILVKIREKFGSGRKWLANKVRSGVERAKALYGSAKTRTAGLASGAMNRTKNVYNSAKATVGNAYTSTKNRVFKKASPATA